MVRFLLRWAINAIAIYVAVRLLPGLDHTGSAASLFGVALIFGLINAAVRPLLLILSCPLIVLSLGLFLLVINGLLLLLTEEVSELFNLGFDVAGLGWAIIGSLVISLISVVLNSLLVEDE